MTSDQWSGDRDAAAEASIRRAERAWWWVGLVALILVLHVATGAWRWMTPAWVWLLVVRTREARRAERAALQQWTPPAPRRRRRRD